MSTSPARARPSWPYEKGTTKYEKHLQRPGVSEVLDEGDVLGTVANLIRQLAPEWGGADRLPPKVILEEWERLALSAVLKAYDLPRAIEKVLQRLKTEQRVQVPLGRYMEVLLSRVPQDRLDACPVPVTYQDLDVTLCCFTCNVLFSDGQCGEKAVIGFFRVNRRETGRACNSQRYYHLRNILEEFEFLKLAERDAASRPRKRAGYRPGKQSMRWRLGVAHPDAHRQPPKCGEIPWRNVERA